MAEREIMEVDVLFVGAGPASLAGAYRLFQLIQEHDAKVESQQIAGKKFGEVTIAVLEKAGEVGLHGFSGCVMDPRGIEELLPDWKEKGFPVEAPVGEDSVNFLTAKRRRRLPFVPPSMNNHGTYVISLAKAVKWMAQQCEELGIQIFPGFAGRELLVEDGRVVGVRTDDKGIGKDGKPKPNFSPGIDIRAKVTILGEGPRGTLAKQAIQRFGLDAGKNPQNYATSAKEIIELPEGRVKPGVVWHTMGYPLKSDTFGGGWIYTMPNNLVSMGLVVALDSPNPMLDSQVELQRLKLHPWIRELLQGGKVVQYGAKTIPEGGYWAMPRLYAAGLLLVGDSGGFLNGARLKGVHLAIKSGIMAAETTLEAMAKEDFGAETLSAMEAKFEASWAKAELWKVRNFHQRFKGGFWTGMMRAGMPLMTGCDPVRRVGAHLDHAERKTIAEYFGHKDLIKEPKIEYDGKLIVDKLTDVYLSGAVHEENQPPHLLIADYNLCATKCREEYGNPCTHFCPAKVYEMVDDEKGGLKMQLAPSNCVHCKTCDIADPYLNITWVPPEAGEGPKYTLL
jgi:electron-transferring-flavoprotein dehydrogenase